MPDKCKGVETALNIIVGKWKPVILFHLLNNGTMRFNELRRAMPGITQKMLTAQLRELEYHDIITRTVYAEVPPRVEYSFTEYGKSVGPMLHFMQEWGNSHMEHMQAIYSGKRTPQPKNY